MTLQRDKLIAWYREAARDLPWRHTRDPYAVWVSEVMLQQTRVDTAIPYYQRFLEAFPTLEALASADEESVLSLWQGLGYYRRARMLREGARTALAMGGLPMARESLLTIPGIGAYTAGAIASIAYGEATPAIDGKAKRVLSRWTAQRQPVDKPPGSRMIEEAATAWVSEAASPGEWNQAIMELGATVCTPSSPKCGACPVRAYCAAHAQGCVGEIPATSPKAEPTQEHWAVAVVVCEGRVLLLRRPQEGLLARMWVFPMALRGDAPALSAMLAELRLTVGQGERLPDAQHRFTHRIWRMSGWWFQAEEALPVQDGRWMDVRELDAGPVPTAVRAYREIARARIAQSAPLS